MRPVDYVRPLDVAEALTLVAERPAARFLGGGTNLIDLIRQGVERPDTLVDTTALPLAGIDTALGGGLRIGATTRNSDLADDHLVRTRYPLLAQAVLAGASGQLRNMATVGGNLHQRTRCPYFVDRESPCNKREPGSGCGALEGIGRSTAVLGTSDHCIAVHPSDMAVALTALEAQVELTGPRGTRQVAMGDFHLAPGETPHLETVTQADELVTAVLLPPPSLGVARYRKVRDRASYAFALVSVAALLDVHDGQIRQARLGLGGVATTPWRAHAAELVLVGAAPTDEVFEAAAAAELAPAKSLPDNAFKVQLARRTIVATLRRLRADGSAS